MSVSNKIVFSDARYFGKGFRPTVDAAFCKMSRMLVAGYFADLDGSIDIAKSAGAWKLDAIWSYVYLLYHFNRTNLDVFASMSDAKTKRASARRFVDTIHGFYDSAPSDRPLDVPTLILFVNETIARYGSRLTNPLFDFLKKSFVKQSNAAAPRRTLNVSGPAVTDDLNSANIRIRLVTTASDAKRIL